MFLRILLLATVCGFVAILLYGKKIIRAILDFDTPTSYFTDLRFRNMNALILGSTKCWKYLNTDLQSYKVYNRACYHRSLLMDEYNLKCYSSHLKPNGTVFLFIDPYENIQLHSKISLADRRHVHPHVFLILAKENSKYTLCNSFEDILYFLQYFWNLLLKKVGWFKRHTWTIKDHIQSCSPDFEVKNVFARVYNMIEYCLERELNVAITVFYESNKCATFYELIYEAFGKTKGVISIDYVKSSQELNAIVVKNLEVICPLNMVQEQ